VPRCAYGLVLDRETTTRLHRRLLDNLENNTSDWADSQVSLNAAVFCDSEVLARERKILFEKTPQPVAFSGEIPEPGCFLALQVLDVPVLLIRADDGELRAFINACAHRGAPVATGSGRTRSLVCPFHGWSYAINGTLRGRPETACFDTPEETHSLSPLPVAEKYGIVVVAICAKVSQQAVTGALDEIGPELASFSFERYRAIDRRQYEVSANWKLVNDLSLESYHFKTLHRDSVAQILAPNAVVDTFGRHSRWAFPLQSIARLAEQEESAWPSILQGSCTYTLYPGVMLIVNSLGAQMIRAEPGATPGESRVVYAGACEPNSNADEARRAYEFGGDVFSREDLPIAAACQSGIEARGAEFPLGRNEPLLQFWHRLWYEALQQA
jgi:phenylpropionate dioxygenase-like ring-hydroxylating dioxygenase large terminal subunit